MKSSQITVNPATAKTSHWRIAGLKGQRDDVFAALNKAKEIQVAVGSQPQEIEIPSQWKEAIKSAIPGDAKAIEIHASATITGQRFMMSLDIRTLF